MKIVFDYPEQQAEIDEYVSGLVHSDVAFHVWHHGDKMIITTGEDIEVNDD